MTSPDAARPPEPPALTAASPRTSLWQLLLIWLALGAQSFGGGVATLFLIRRAAVERYGWLSDEEFTRTWSLCFAVPGINLLCLTILLGNRVAGLAGALVALAGLLVPSVAITIVITAAYGSLQQVALVQAGLEGVIPATVGLGLLLSFGMTRPLLQTSRREGNASLLLSLLLFGGSIAATALLRLPVPAILAGAGLIGALVTWWWAARGGRP